MCLLPPSMLFAQDTGLVDGTGVTAHIVHEQGTWTVTYHFDRPQKAMFFNRYTGGYRERFWTSLSSGVEIRNIGGFDTILLDTPSTTASFDITAYTTINIPDANPFIPFTDGGLTLFTGQFDLLPALDAADVADLQGDLFRWQGKQPTLGVTFTSDEPVIMEGALIDGTAVHVTFGGGTHIYTGLGRIEEGNSFVGVIDSALPEWLRENLDEEVTAIFAEHEKRWGFELEQRATLLIAFDGYGASGYRNSGSAFGNTLMLQIAGDALRNEDADIMDSMRWFFAHEAAHLYQLTAGLEILSGDSTWMMEGSANAMANQIVASLDGNAVNLAETYDRALTECDAYLQDGPLEGAGKRDAELAYYECGDLVAIITASLLPDHNLHGFLKELALDRREGSTGSWQYFSTMHRLGADPDAIISLADIVYKKLSDPRQAYIDALNEARLYPLVSGDGRIVSINIPLE
uniref:Peptidase M1 membrane alanine aminopeptidase domain-containing protein n=1 Tax=Aquisalinus luteolus TaxID=1566827 RepID=A0A8J3A2Z1_9PROT|nr:hypothetical protein GCM10011355_21600 [Aquisalinus luteolus]